MAVINLAARLVRDLDLLQRKVQTCVDVAPAFHVANLDTIISTEKSPTKKRILVSDSSSRRRPSRYPLGIPKNPPDATLPVCHFRPQYPLAAREQDEMDCHPITPTCHGTRLPIASFKCFPKPAICSRDRVERWAVRVAQGPSFALSDPITVYLCISAT